MNNAASFRHIFAGIIFLFMAFAQENGSAQSNAPALFTKKAMLRDIVSVVIAPGYQDLASKCRELMNSVERLAKTSNRTNLDSARKSWLATAQAAERMRCFQSGPIASRDFVSTFYYWRIIPVRIEELLASSRAIDQPTFDELGAAAKGLFALEYLLFDGKENTTEGPKALPVLELFSNTNAQRRAAFLVALARDVETKAGQLAGDWIAPGKDDASAKFIAGEQETVNLLVNQLTAAIEYAAERRLNFMLVLPRPISSQFNRLEAVRSGSSLTNLITFVQGVQKMYRGGDALGLDDSLKRVNPSLEKRVNEQFEAAIAAIQAVGAPLEQAIVDNPASLQNAYEKTRALEILFKVDLASALGVTLTFNSTDGD